MTIIQTFPRFHKFLPKETHTLEFHPSDVGYIISMLERVMISIRNDHEQFQQLCLNLHMDFNEAIQRGPQHAITYQFGKFSTATVAASVFSSDAASTATFEWLVASLGDEYPAGIRAEYEMGYLVRFLVSETQCNVDFVNEILCEGSLNTIC